ncbi:MAG: ABC transporter substrate-binding protein [Brevefilum sp.]|jgi:sulfonate transport system substrate-binding protein
MMKKFAKMFVVIMVLTMLISACAPKAPEGPKEPEKQDTSVGEGETTFGLIPFEEKQTLRIGFFTGSPLSYPFLFADKLGYFDELNIEIVYKPFTNGPAMNEANADWDIGGVGLGGLANGMRGYGFHIIDIVDYEDNLALFARAGTPLAEDPTNPENWKGTEWIYPAGTTAQATLVSALKEVGLSLDDIVSINMDVSNALTGFNGGTGDGLGVWNVIAFNAEDAGHIRIGDSGSLGFKAPCGTIVTPETLEAKRELIETAVAVFKFTTEWLYESDENMAQATQWFLENVESEGLKIDESVAQRVMDWYRGPTMAEYFEIYTEKSPDDAGLYTSRDLIQAEKDILVGLDFFISQGNYTNEERTEFLDNGLIDPSVALGIKAMLEKLNIDY